MTTSSTPASAPAPGFSAPPPSPSIVLSALAEWRRMAGRTRRGLGSLVLRG